jgi:zinc protease
MTGGINHLLKLSGMSMLFALFTPDVSARRISQAIASEIKRIQTQGISPAEMQKVRNATLTSRVFEMYAADHICQRLGYAQTVEGDYRLWVERLKALEKLTLDEVVAAARTYWDESRRQTLLLTPKKIKPLVFFAGIVRRLIPQR